MLKHSLPLLLSLSLIGCDIPKTEYSSELTEQGKVINLIFVPEGHGSTSGFGYTSEGDAVFTSSSVHIPARYGIIFECQHGSFVINTNPEQFNKLQKDQDVTIHYRRVYRITKKQGKQLVDLDFLYATPSNVEEF